MPARHSASSTKADRRPLPWLSLILLASFLLVLVLPFLKAERQKDAVLDSLTPPGRRLLIRQVVAVRIKQEQLPTSLVYSVHAISATVRGPC